MRPTDDRRRAVRVRNYQSSSLLPGAKFSQIRLRVMSPGGAGLVAGALAVAGDLMGHMQPAKWWEKI
jgi:hypothetical protein